MEDLWIINSETRNRFIAHIQRIDLSAPLKVVITDQKAKRSELQNRYLFGWVYMQLASLLANAGIVIRTETGEIPWTKDLLHEVMKTKFLMIGEVKSRGGRVIPVYQSTTKLSKQAFGEFVQNVKNLAYQFWGIDIPEPPVKSIYREWENVV
jgi:hypothetical protein